MRDDVMRLWSGRGGAQCKRGVAALRVMHKDGVVGVAAFINTPCNVINKPDKPCHVRHLVCCPTYELILHDMMSAAGLGRRMAIFVHSTHTPHIPHNTSQNTHIHHTHTSQHTIHISEHTHTWCTQTLTLLVSIIFLTLYICSGSSSKTSTLMLLKDIF